jgi:hypothetical protein
MARHHCCSSRPTCVSIHYFAPPCRPMTEKWVEFNSGATLKKKVMSGVSVAKRLARHFTFARSRVLTSVPPDQVWVFFRDFPTPLDIAVCLISQIRRMLGQYQPLSTYHLPSEPILTVPIPNLPFIVSVAEEALESLSSPPPFGGE